MHLLPSPRASPPPAVPAPRPMRATPVIAGSLAGFVLLAVCIATLWLLRKRKRRLQRERAIRLSEFLHDDRSNRRSLPDEPATTPTPSDPDKHRPPSPSLHRRHRRSRTPTPSSSPSPHPNRAASEDNSDNNNNRLREGRTSNSDGIFARQGERREGDCAGVLIPAIVISPNVNTRGQEEYDEARISDTRPSSRRTEGSTSLSTPSLAPRSSTLLYPAFDSSSSASSTSFSSPLLSSQSSSPTIPSSSSPILPSSASLITAPSSPACKNLVPSQNHERSAVEGGVHVEEGSAVEVPFIGPSLRRSGGGEEDAPPAYEKCVGE